MKNKIKRIHFIGIGGSGMSGIAEVMQTLGFTVSGSDLAISETIKSLKKLGIKVYSEHSKANIKKVDTIVFSNAISRLLPLGFNNSPTVKFMKNKFPEIYPLTKGARLFNLHA